MRKWIIWLVTLQWRPSVRKAEEEARISAAAKAMAVRLLSLTDALAAGELQLLKLRQPEFAYRVQEEIRDIHAIAELHRGEAQVALIEAMVSGKPGSVVIDEETGVAVYREGELHPTGLGIGITLGVNVSDSARNPNLGAGFLVPDNSSIIPKLISDTGRKPDRLCHL